MTDESYERPRSGSMTPHNIDGIAVSDDVYDAVTKESERRGVGMTTALHSMLRTMAAINRFNPEGRALVVRFADEPESGHILSIPALPSSSRVAVTATKE